MMTPAKRATKPAEPPKAYSYLRFSTPEQSKGDSHRRQTQLAADYAHRRGLQLDTELTFHDLGVSAFRGTNRVTGALGGFLNAVLSGAVPAGSFLLIESIDRLSRQSAWDALPTLQAIVNADITLVTLAPEREISRRTMADNPFLLMEVLIYMIRANEESATKSRRVKEVWKNKRTEAPNRVMTTWCPSWLALDKENNTFAVVPERAAVVQRVFGDTLQGCAPDSIVQALNLECVPVFGRGKFWHRSFIDRLLQNETVIGTLTPHSISYSGGRMVRNAQTPVPDYYPAVIDPAVFQRVQSLRAGARSPMRGKNASKEVSNVFGGGMARCGRCGASLIRVNKGKGRGKYNKVSLVCSAAKAGAGCVYEMVKYETVENAFIAELPRLAARAPAGNKHKALDKQVEGLEASIAGSEDALERLLDSLAASRSAAVEARILETESEIAAMKAQLTELERQRADAAGPIVQSRLNDLAEAAQAQPINRTYLNALLRQSVARIDLHFDDRLLTLEWKQGGSADVRYSMPEHKEKGAFTVAAWERSRRTHTKPASRGNVKGR